MHHLTIFAPHCKRKTCLPDPPPHPKFLSSPWMCIFSSWNFLRKYDLIPRSLPCLPLQSLLALQCLEVELEHPWAAAQELRQHNKPLLIQLQLKDAVNATRSSFEGFLYCLARIAKNLWLALALITLYLARPISKNFWSACDPRFWMVLDFLLFASNSFSPKNRQRTRKQNMLTATFCLLFFPLGDFSDWSQQHNPFLQPVLAPFFPNNGRVTKKLPNIQESNAYRSWRSWNTKVSTWVVLSKYQK